MNAPSESIAEPSLSKALAHLQSILVAGETLEAWAVQRRVYALKHRRMLVAATSGRLICLSRRLLGGFDLTDFRWQDLEEVRLGVGVFAAELIVRAGSASDLASQGTAVRREMQLLGLRKGQAEAVYRICQAQDQAWREKRRIRELEELRARAGGVQLSSGAAGAGAASGDTVRRLQEAKQMLDARLITDAEFEAIKAKIISSS